MFNSKVNIKTSSINKNSSFSIYIDQQKFLIDTNKWYHAMIEDCQYCKPHHFVLIDKIIK